MFKDAQLMAHEQYMYVSASPQDAQSLLVDAL